MKFLIDLFSIDGCVFIFMKALIGVSYSILFLSMFDVTCFQTETLFFF